MILNRKTGALLAVLLTVSAGCYGGKMIKMPINAEMAYRQVDTLRVRQEEIVRALNALSAELKAEREANLNNRVATQSTLGDMEQALRALASKVDANTQLLTSAFGPAMVSTSRRPTVIGPDSLPGDSSLSAGGVSQPRPGGAGEEDGEGVYKAAYMDLTLGNYSLAIQGFKNYLVKFPSGARLPEVHYYLGESYYAGDRQLEAVGEFQYVIKEFPDSRLVPAAMLKSGICYAALEERTLAARAFRELISKYPDSEEAQRAQTALAELEE